MTEHYVNMRLKMPHFLHAQLRRKQKEMKRIAISDHVTLEDAAIGDIDLGLPTAQN